MPLVCLLLTVFPFIFLTFFCCCSASPVCHTACVRYSLSLFFHSLKHLSASYVPVAGVPDCM